jgi:hypothetical protein
MMHARAGAMREHAAGARLARFEKQAGDGLRAVEGDGYRPDGRRGAYFSAVREFFRAQLSTPSLSAP